MVHRKELPPLLIRLYSNWILTDNRQVDYVWWPTTAIRQNNINLLILDWTLIILNWKRSESKTQNYFLFPWTGNRLFFYYYYFQVKTKLLRENQFTVLRKCQSKFDCLVFEMLFIKKLKPNLNIQTDSIRAKLFV